MIERARPRWMRFAAAVCLTVATILVGFAHRPLPGFGSVTATIGGSNIAFAGFCAAPRRGAARDDAPAGTSTLRVCDACLLFAAPGLGAVAEFEPAPPPGCRVDAPAIVAEAARSASVARARARGPPRRA